MLGLYGLMGQRGQFQNVLYLYPDEMSCFVVFFLGILCVQRYMSRGFQNNIKFYVLEKKSLFSFEDMGSLQVNILVMYFEINKIIGRTRKQKERTHPYRN